MTYILPDKAYKVLKWIGLVLLPVIGWAYGELAPDFGIDPYKVTHFLDVGGTVIGALIGYSAITAHDPSNDDTAILPKVGE